MAIFNMNNNEISVLAFCRDDSARPPWQIQGHIERAPDALNVNLMISGETDAILVNMERNHPIERRDELWKHTCFELFIAEHNKENYWEYNLAPNGHWNCYQFSHYRSPPMSTTVAAVGQSRISNVDNRLSICFRADLAPEIRTKDLQANLCCVIETKDHKHYYHAGAHPAGKPDFHDRRGFVINIPAS